MLVNSLATLTGTDVAASDDLTGNAAFGADWELEYRTGQIETSVAISTATQESWINVMAVNVDASSSGSTADQASVTVSHTTAGANRLMLVGITMNPSGESVSSVTYNGVNLTHVGTQEDGAALARVEIWSLVAPDTGTHDVVVNFTDLGHKGASVGVMTFTGVDQTTALGAFSGNSGLSASASTTVASATDDLVFGVVAVEKGTAVTPGAGQTEYWDIDVNANNGAGTIEAGAASVTTSWTNDLKKWSAAAVSIQADTTATILDQFNTDGSYAGNDGTQNWSNDWQELGESDGAGSGNVSVVSSPDALRIGSNGMISGDGAWREVDLSMANSATLTLDVWRSASRAASITLAISDDGGTNWTNLQTWTFSSLTSSPSLKTFDISAYTSANTQIRFLGAGEADSAYFYADNIQIEYTTGDVTAPVQINNTGSTVAEGGTDTISNTELRYDDYLQPATSVTYSVTTSPDHGRLEFVSAPGAPITTFTQDDLDNNRVRYVHDGTENFLDSFNFNVDDGQGNTLTGQSFNLTITPVNDAPTLTALSHNPTYTEGDAAVNLFGFVTANSIESGQTIEELVFTVTNVTDGSPQGNQEQVTLDGSTFALTDLASGTTATNGYGYSVSLAGNTATVTLTTTGATVANIANLGGSLGYSNSSDNPSTLDRVFTITSIKDSGGTANGGIDTFAPNLVSTVTVVAVNDAPVVNGTASDTGTEDTDVVYTHAQLLTLIGATDVDDANANLSIAISNINNGTLVMSGGSGGAGTTFTFTPTANFDGNMTFDYQVSDDESPTPASSVIGAGTVALSAVNDAPVFSGLDNTPTYIEGGAAVQLDADVTISDSERDALNSGNGDYTAAVIRLERNGSPNSEDVFSIPSGGNLTVVANNIYVGGNLMAGFGNSGGQFALIFANSGTVPTTALVNEVLQAIAYSNSNISNPPASVQIDYTFEDGNSGAQGSGGLGVANGSINVTITPVNDAPVVNATASDSGTEDTDVVYTHAQLLTLIGATDVDDANANLSIAVTNINNGTLVMSGGTGGAGTTFTFTPTANFVGNLSFDYQVSDDESPTPAASTVGTATVALSAVNDTPTDIALSSNTVNENTDTTGGYSVGTLTTTDADGGDSHGYTVVGGADMGVFSIGGAGLDELMLTDGTLDFESQSSYEVIVRSTDNGSPNLFRDETLTITVNDQVGNISGTIFTDEGVTSIGAGVSISMVVNGVLTDTVTTDGAGAYTFNKEAAAGDAVAIFIDNDPTHQGITVTVSDGSDLGGIQVYANHVVVRNDNGGVISIADMDNALGAYADPDIHYAVIGGNLVANALGSELLVPAGHTFTPGGDVNVTSIKIMGTVNGGNNTFNIAENWNSTPGDWNADTSTVNLIGTGVLLQNTSATPWVHGFNNLSVAAAGQTTTLSSVIWTNQLTTGSGVLTDAASSHALYLQGTGNVFVDGGGTLDFDALHYRVNNATQNVAGSDYSGINNLYFNAVGGPGGNGNYDIQGNIIANDVHVIVNNNGNPAHVRNSIVNTNNFDFTAANLYLGVNGEPEEYATFNAGSSTVNISGDVIVHATDANGTSAINAGSSSWTVSGDWINNDSFTAGSSTVVLDGTGTLNSTGAFYNLTTGAASQTTTLTSNLRVGNVLTIADATGTLTDGGGGHDITVLGGGTPFVNNGATVIANKFIYSNGNPVTVTVAGGTYTVAESLQFDGRNTGMGTTFQLNGDLLVNGAGAIQVFPIGSGLAILDTTVSSHNITASSLQVGNSLFQAGFLYAHNSTIDINGDVSFIWSANTTIHLGGSNWSVAGNWANTSGSFTAGTSTVNFDGASQQISGSTAFYNLTKIESSNDGTDSVLTFDNTATQTINGTLTLTGLDADDRISLVSDSPGNRWNLNLAASATHALDYIVVTDSDASGSDPGHLTINPANSFNGGNDIGWFGAIAVDDGYTVDEGSTTNLDLSANDSDSDGLDLASIVITSGPANGSIVVNANGTVDYTHDGSETVSDSFTYTIKDSLGNVSNIATATITVNPVNDAPVVNATASDTGTEDTDQVYTHAQLLTLIGASDDDDANVNLGIAITNVNNGTLVMSGGSGGAGTTFTFTPTANFVGNLTFDYQVSDDESPTPASSAIGTATVALSAVNDAPVFNGLDGTPTYIEDGAAVQLDADVTISDIERDALNGGNGDYTASVLTLQRNGGANPEDVFTIPSGGNLTVAGGNIFVGGNLMAGFGYSGGQLSLIFANSGTVPTTALVSEVLQAITYSNSNTGNPPASVQIDYTLNDANSGTQGSGGSGVANGSINVTITPVNDVPTDISLSNSSVNENTDTGSGYSVGTLTSTDPDTGDSHSYAVVGGADMGVFSIGGAGLDELILTDGVLDFETQIKLRGHRAQHGQRQPQPVP